MHIITGIMLMELARRLRQPGQVLLPQLNVGPIQTAHVLPGRIRFRVPLLREDEEAAELLEQRLPTLDGVRAVTVDRVTGSVLVTHDPAETEGYLILCAIARLLGLEDALASTPDPAPLRHLKDLGAAMNQAVYQHTYGFMDLRSLVPLFCAYYGVRGLLTAGWQSAPGGLTLLWWAWASLNHGKGA